MAYLGLVPKHLSVDNTKRGGITKAGSSHARRVLVESAALRECVALPSPALRRCASQASRGTTRVRDRDRRQGCNSG
jgi:transposase